MREYFDLELKALNDKLIEMGALVEGAIKNTITIITTANTINLKHQELLKKNQYDGERNTKLLFKSPPFTVACCR